MSATYKHNKNVATGLFIRLRRKIIVRISTDVSSPQYKNKFFYIRLNENVLISSTSWPYLSCP